MGFSKTSGQAGDFTAIKQLDFVFDAEYNKVTKRYMGRNKKCWRK
jgi:hypothetical protein